MPNTTNSMGLKPWFHVERLTSSQYNILIISGGNSCEILLSLCSTQHDSESWTYTADRRHTALHAIIAQICTFNINEPPSNNYRPMFQLQILHSCDPQTINMHLGRGPPLKPRKSSLFPVHRKRKVNARNFLKFTFFSPSRIQKSPLRLDS
jgi:hypothetical protein